MIIIQKVSSQSLRQQRMASAIEPPAQEHPAWCGGGAAERPSEQARPWLGTIWYDVYVTIA